jgi:formylglycine-generating enzyme required for sulfatase activity
LTVRAANVTFGAVDRAELLERIADQALSIDERCAAAATLAELGDPRLDAALVRVSAGTLQHRASRDARPEPVPMPAFAIQRHLVTVAEYAEFIAEGGYDDPSLWSAEGWRWRLDEDCDRPRFWGEDEWALYLLPNQPVVGVSWFEADAYASFRGRRLPTELEWERACRGDDARLFPWGDAWDDHACPHRDYGPRRTKAIGLFPPSPLGLYDMVGNVWQWTADMRPSPPRGDEAVYLVCGGAWNNLPWSIGCGARNAFPPTARFSNLGFRCAAEAR